MGQFGEDLRKERESRGIALETITDSTKISGRHLSALEEEQFERLPGGIFNKGIVRGYARVVGLDEEAWVGRYLSATEKGSPPGDETDGWVQFAENVVKSRQNEVDRSTIRLRWAGVILLVALVATLGWFVYRYVHEKVDTHSAQNGVTQTASLVSGSFALPPGRPLRG